MSDVPFGCVRFVARARLMPDLYVHIYMFVLFVCSAVGRQMEGHLKEVSINHIVYWNPQASWLHYE